VAFDPSTSPYPQQRLIDTFSGRVDDESMRHLVMSFKGAPLDSEMVFRLADALARSGERLEPADEAADIASTGAPTSLSTLLCPLYLRSHGFTVPKLGVPGRPAGGIDVLAQLSDYRTGLHPAEIRDVLAKCGYAHFLADTTFAPADAKLFDYRQKNGYQDVPALAAASLLAKKMACGIRTAGLDVRVAPHGNFGKTFQEARDSAQLFCGAAAVAGIRAVAILTDARRPYQPYIGRGEALLALKIIFDGGVDGLLAEHADRCRLMAQHVAQLAGVCDATDQMKISHTFAENLVAQGSSYAAFEEKVHAIKSEHRRELTAAGSGFVVVDLAALRSIFVDVNRPRIGTAFPDHLGVIMRANVGAYVPKGHILATLRISDSAWPALNDRLAGAVRTDILPDDVPGVEGIIHA
jgi:pyrimidine-nucleoside phosphorylase